MGDFQFIASMTQAELADELESVHRRFAKLRDEHCTQAARIAVLEADLTEAVAVIEGLRAMCEPRGPWGPATKRADALLARLGQSEESDDA